MVLSWRPPLCKRAIGSEKSFSIHPVCGVESCKMTSKTKGQFVSVGFITNWNFEMLAAMHIYLDSFEAWIYLQKFNQKCTLV